jgi:hypothetical protein
MPSHLEIADSYVKAANAKDVEACLALLTENAIMDSPMGPKKGKAEIRGLLNFLLRMMGDSIAAPTLIDGVPATQFNTPGGRARMTFHFEGELISQVKVQVGVK